MGDTPEREIRSVPMESVGGVKKKSKTKESKDVPSFYRAFRRLKKSLLSKPRVLKKDKMSVESQLTEV